MDIEIFLVLGFLATNIDIFKEENNMVSMLRLACDVKNVLYQVSLSIFVSIF